MSHRYSAIYSALVTKLKLYTGWSDAACAWPNRPFQPGTSAYWKVDFLPTAVDSTMGNGGSLHERGVFQVTRFEPIKAGAASAMTAADAMASHFDRVKLAGTGVTVQCFVPEVITPLVGDQFYQVPISIRFIAL